MLHAQMEADGFNVSLQKLVFNFAAIALFLYE